MRGRGAVGLSVAPLTYYISFVVLAGARTLKRRLSAARAHSRGSGDSTDGFPAAAWSRKEKKDAGACYLLGCAVSKRLGK